MSARPVIFLTDFGEADGFAGVCRAVIARYAPGTEVIDLTHRIDAGDVRRGALALAAVVPYAPPGAVYLAVVDPGVGTERRAVALPAGQSYLVGPDNGLLWPAAQELGGARPAIDISRTPVRLEPTSDTFHGRDIFAPVAAALARGGPMEGLGEPLDPPGLSELELPRPRVEPGRLVAHILYSDGFGNLVLDATPEDLEAAGLGSATVLSVAVAGGERAAIRGKTFADARGGLVLYDDSGGRLGLAFDRRSATDEIGAGRDDELRIEAAA